MASNSPLSPDQLCKRCDPDSFSFKTTAELEDFKEMLGQDRAVEAIQFGVAVEHDGYNLFVLGPPGTGRHSFVRQFLTQTATTKSPPSDWCYINNFEQPRQPIAIELPAGKGHQFREDVAQLVRAAYSAMPKAFENETYQQRRQDIEEKIVQHHTEAFKTARVQAKVLDLDVVETATGFLFVPFTDGKAMPSDEFNNLPEEERDRIEEKAEPIAEELSKMLQELPLTVLEVQKELTQLKREVALFSIGNLIAHLIDQYNNFPAVVDYLHSFKNDAIENIELFLDSEATDDPVTSDLFPMSGTISEIEDRAFELSAEHRYSVNVLVDHRHTAGAPVVYEDTPIYPTLIGRVEHLAQMGALITDFTLIRAGVLHQANGGYLILDAQKVLSEPLTWEALKRVLKSHQIQIKSVSQDYSVISTVTLDPMPIPLSMKVVLIGDRDIYYALQAYDPEFSELFKVAADFEDDMLRTADNEQGFAQLVGTLARQDNLMPLDRSGVARVVEVSARLANDAERLSTQIRKIADIVREAHYWAQEQDKSVIDAVAVQQAIDQQVRRESRVKDRLQQDILRNTVLINTAGKEIGQMNALAIFHLGETPVAHPSRITARVSLGEGNVIDIEREVELGGPIHSKGVLILSSFLATNYVSDQPLPLSASLVFEQSYSGIEGDSASAAELCALLSALAQIPLYQSIAMTGSVNQYGQVQAIGGVNEKIEGFFDVCKLRGLKGDQGVIIPTSNVKHLMLRQDVVEAAAEGQFHIYTVKTIDQGMEILTGLKAGQRDPSGKFPEGTLNHRIVTSLLGYAQKRDSLKASCPSKDDDA